VKKKRKLKKKWKLKKREFGQQKYNEESPALIHMPQLERDDVVYWKTNDTSSNPMDRKKTGINPVIYIRTRLTVHKVLYNVFEE